MRGRHFAPDALVIDASLRVLGLVDERNTLAVVEDRRLAVLAVLEGEKGSVSFLGSLASLETEEKALGVESAIGGKNG